MNVKHKLGLVAITIIIFCLTLVVITVFIALWAQREIVAWCVLGLAILGTLVCFSYPLNEMALRHKRYRHQYETPLDAHGYPTLLQPGQQPYQPYAQVVMRGARPHDGEGSWNDDYK